jgi:undecaprenyl pyrophosphate phosphatase UppP
MAYKSFYYSLLIFIQSITESLPFSSSTHVYLFKNFIAKNFFKSNNRQIEHYLEDFAHGCTAVGLIPFFFQFRPNLNLGKLTIKWILIVDVITALGYLFLKPKIEHFKPALGLFVTAFILLMLKFIPVNYDYCFFADISLTLMYDFMINWQLIFLYPLIMGIICLTIFLD